jgi:hypothetical protein
MIAVLVPGEGNVTHLSVLVPDCVFFFCIGLDCQRVSLMTLTPFFLQTPLPRHVYSTSRTPVLYTYKSAHKLVAPY